jgi:integrase
MCRIWIARWITVLPQPSAANRVMVRLIYRHGLRASEACYLRWDHLNLDEGTITVRRRKLRRETNSPYVFTTECGGPLSVRALQYVVARGRKGRRPARGALTPARAAHAAGYSLINNDVDLRLVQEFLGHKTPAMTMHYAAVPPKRLQALRVG